MKNIFQQKWVRRILQGLSLTSAAAILQACYGVPRDYRQDMLIQGKIVDVEGSPISNINVQVDGTSYTPTDENGEFGVYLPVQREYTFNFAGNDQFEGRDTLIVNENDSTVSFKFVLYEKSPIK